MTKIPATVFSIFLLLAVLRFTYASGEETNESVTYSLSDVSRQSANIQERQANCGPLALARCLAIAGRTVPFEEIHGGFTAKTEAGVRLIDLLERTKFYFPHAAAVTVTNKNWKTLPRPAIVILKEQGHCLVFEGLDTDGQKIHLWDPEILGHAEYTLESINEIWGGEVILLSGTPRILTPVNCIMLVISALCIIGAVYWIISPLFRPRGAP
jgi:hypothetical protein